MEDKLIYSTWKDKDLAALVPGMEAAVRPDGSWDAPTMKTAIDRNMMEYCTNVQQLLQSPEATRFAQANDPEALATLLEGLEKTFRQMRQTACFFTLIPHHAKETQDGLNETARQLSEKNQATMGIVGQAVSAFQEAVRRLDSNTLDKMFESSENLQKYKGAIRVWQENPKLDPQKAQELFSKSRSVMEALEKVSVNKPGESPEDKKKNFAEALSGMMHFKQMQAEAYGFKNTKQHFAVMNKVPPNILDLIPDEKSPSVASIISGTKEMKKLAQAKYDPLKKKEYSFDEAKDIVCAAYSRIDPEFGIIAKRAFDEGWIAVNEYYATHPATLPAIPAKHGGHPFAMSMFHGNVKGIRYLGHEMAHVIHNYLSTNGNHTVFTETADPMTQEIFSHLGESLIEREMLARASEDQQKRIILIHFKKSDEDILSVLQYVKFEEELYALVEKRNGKDIAYQEINDIFRKHRISENPDSKEEVAHASEIWHTINQPPYTSACYPLNKILADAILEAYDRDPAVVGKKIRAAMEAGATKGASEIWDDILGKGKVSEPGYLESRYKIVDDKIRALNAELRLLPDIKKEKPALGTLDDETKRFATELGRNAASAIISDKKVGGSIAETETAKKMRPPGPNSLG